MRLFIVCLTSILLLQGCTSGKNLFSKKDSIENQHIDFDFANPVMPDVKTIRPKQNIELTLKNVPVNAYEVSINDSLITTPNEPPAIFSQLFKIPDLSPVPTSAPKTSGEIEGVTPRDSTSTPAIAKKKEKANEDELNDLLGEYAAIESGVSDILRYATIPQELKRYLLDCSSTQAALTGKANDYIRQQIPVLDNSDAAALFPAGIEPVVTQQSKDMKDRITRFLSDAEELKKKYQSILGDANGGITLNDYRALEKSIGEKTAAIDKALSNAKALKTKMEEFEKAGVGEAIVTAYNSIAVARKNFPKLVLSGFGVDEVLIKVNVKKKENINCVTEISSFPIAVVTRGGVKIDFSPALVVNLGSTYFFDQKYHYDSVYRPDHSMADSVSITRNRNNNVVVTSLGMFMNVYGRGLRQVKMGGLLGASIGTDQRVYFHVGGSLLMGKSDRAVLGFGVSIAKATVLDGQYDQGQIIKRGLAPSTIPTEEATRIGGFLSLGYNLNLIK